MVRTVIIEREDIENELPCLMVTNGGKVVLMTGIDNGLGRGVVIVSDYEHQSVGYSTDSWAMEDFRPLKGKVVLENK